SDSRARFLLATDMDNPIWLRLQGSQVKDGDVETDYVFATFGAHRKVGDNTLVGLMLMLDQQREQNKSAMISGTGWLAGPYVVGRLPEHGITYDARALWGQSTNDVQPFGTYTDTFKTDRMLLSFGLSGTLDYGATTLTPRLSGTYTTDKQRSYVDGLGNTIPEQDVALTQVMAGLNASRSVTFGETPWTLTGGVDAIHTASGGANASSTPNFEGTRGRINMGLLHRMDSGGQIKLGLTYDGIGVDDYTALGLTAAFEIAF
ncbi:MAG: autotransporter domain-containing protein, partial [Pseudomonadota bacterium]